MVLLGCGTIEAQGGEEKILTQTGRENEMREAKHPYQMNRPHPGWDDKFLAEYEAIELHVLHSVEDLGQEPDNFNIAWIVEELMARKATSKTIDLYDGLELRLIEEASYGN